MKTDMLKCTEETLKKSIKYINERYRIVQIIPIYDYFNNYIVHYEISFREK
jgi:hypothetical protein